ncbi:cytochrome C biogenesis protein CcdA [Haloarcula taiwanensis]|uniref:Cytochrome C biogenesis protein CcdA n=1 Tax=Haloarcula taiwanensis TaxID=1932004 RepID=A0A2H4ZZ65_9EURY|nr:cytochrome c biogenesis CcdA family protein [Haloarcula taiwanensis]AUG47730.1 cytochrome C biogenesis protein CcdA [Haloarcula taiwanensis]
MAAVSLLASFAAGAMTVLTPCCLPVLPPLLSGSVGHRLKPLAIVGGSVVSFTLVGLVTGYLGTLTSDSLRAPAFLVIIAFGAVMADDDLHEAYAATASKVSGRVDGLGILSSSAHPIAAGFALGLVIGILWLPCVGPVLGAVLAYAGTTGDISQSGLLLFSYGVGFGLPMLGVAYGSKVAGGQVREVLPGAERTESVRRLAGYLLLVSGVALLFQLDRVLLSTL